MTLTSEQCDVVQAGIDTRQLVLAGPGTGKTHALVARLVHLVEVCGVQPGQEILVLSFTRNAVREIRRRVHDHGGDVAYVSAMTFDSFATRILATVAPDAAWRNQGYDDRIRAFTAAVREGTTGLSDHLADLRHVLVDEIQDLVTDRADLVEALLETCECGFTLLGDPAQAIYGYQLSDGRTRGPSVADWATERFPDLVVRRLHQTHRFKASTAEVALPYGVELCSPTVSADVQEALRETYRRLPLMRNLQALGTAASRGTVGVICRNNGQALLVSEKLYRLGINHTLFGDAVAAPVEAWLARAFFDCDAPAITRTDLSLLLSQVDSELDDQEAWLALRAMGRDGKTVDLGRVATRLAARWIPDALVRNPDAPIIVSSIHRAKGLEFDQVVVVFDLDDFGEDSIATTLAEESRVLFVALTRARRGLFRFDQPREWG